MPWVLFFDGDCGLCSGSIRRLAKWDGKGLIHYAPLQGNLAAQRGLERYLYGDQASMVLLNTDGGEVFTQSDSVLQILRLLSGAWRLLLVFGVLPRSFRNWIYRLIARNRRRWFVQSAPVCEMPDAALRSRLLD